MLSAHDLDCQRGDRLLFTGLSFAVTAGHCLHVAGENGAGKTSLLRILCGLSSPIAGDVRLDGHSIRDDRDAYASALLYIGHAAGVKDELTARENLDFSAALRGDAVDATAIDAALGAVGLRVFADLPVRMLSQGQRRRVALARLFLPSSARVWILDEPFTALDTRGVATLAQCIGAHLGRGGIVVLTTHQDVALPISVERLELRALEPA